MALSLRKAIISGVLLCLLLVPNLGLLNNWNWTHIYSTYIPFSRPLFLWPIFFYGWIVIFRRNCRGLLHKFRGPMLNLKRQTGRYKALRMRLKN